MMGSSSDDVLIVSLEESAEAWELAPGETLTFGRSERTADIGLDPGNDWLHRTVGRLAWDRSMWWVENVGTRIPLLITKAESRYRVVLPPGESTTVPGPDAWIALEARRCSYQLTCRQRDARPPLLPALDHRLSGERSTMKYGLKLTPDQRRLLAALCEPRLSVGETAPPADDAIAQRFGWTEKAVERKLANIRQRLHDQGAPGLIGGDTSAAHLRRRRLVDLLVDHQLITFEHLTVLDADG